MKKKILIICISIILICILGFYLQSFHIKESSFCPFCEQKVINYQKYYENENIIGLYSYRPLFKGHCLILPKRHVERLESLNQKEIKEIFDLINKTHLAMQKIIAVKSYMILQKNGKDVGQTVKHLHFHYIPNKKNGSNFSFLFNFVMYPFMQKINKKEMNQMTKFISQNI